MIFDFGYTRRRADHMQQWLCFASENRSAQRYPSVMCADLDRVGIRDHETHLGAQALDEH